MNIQVFSYRFAEEILRSPRFDPAWHEIEGILTDAPLFIYPNKSPNNARLDVVQQLMNTYFDKAFAVDSNWDYHPLATHIPDSGLTADYRKTFNGLRIQVEVQFGNMARWYSDIFKFQAAYSESLIDLGLCVIPMTSLATRVDSNVVNFERTLRELPSARLSITLPILLVGISPDEATPSVNARECRFQGIKQITGRGAEDNRWRIINGFSRGDEMRNIGPTSEVGRTLEENEDDVDE